MMRREGTWGAKGRTVTCQLGDPGKSFQLGESWIPSLKKNMPHSQGCDVDKNEKKAYKGPSIIANT